MVPVGPAGTHGCSVRRGGGGGGRSGKGAGCVLGKGQGARREVSLSFTLSLSRSLCFFLLAGGAQGERRSADEWCNAAPTKTTCKFFSTTATHSHSFGQTLFSILRVTHYTHTTTATSVPLSDRRPPCVFPSRAPPPPPRRARTNPNNLDSTSHRHCRSSPSLPSISPFNRNKICASSKAVWIFNLSLHCVYLRLSCTSLDPAHARLLTWLNSTQSSPTPPNTYAEREGATGGRRRGRRGGRRR